jgi:hypothetical protein
MSVHFIAAGLACIAYAVAHWTCTQPYQYFCLLDIGLVASGLKVELPSVSGSMSVSYVFVLLSMMDFSYPETEAVACLSMVVQSVWQTRTPGISPAKPCNISRSRSQWRLVSNEIIFA